MALECYADAADYQALYGDDLTGAALDNALWQASRDADRLALGRIEAAGGPAGLNDRCAELVTQAVCPQAHRAGGAGAAWGQGLQRDGIAGSQMEVDGSGRAGGGSGGEMRELLALTGLCCREVGP